VLPEKSDQRIGDALLNTFLELSDEQLRSVTSKAWPMSGRILFSNTISAVLV
jgi:hypothetical protein